ARVTRHAIEPPMDFSWILLRKISAGVELVFSVVDQANYAVGKISDFIFFTQVYLAPVIDRVSLWIGDDSDKWTFGVRLVHSRLEYNRQFVRLQHHHAADRDDANTVHEQLEQHG